MCNIDDNLQPGVQPRRNSSRNRSGSSRSRSEQNRSNDQYVSRNTGICAIMQKLDDGTLLEVLLRLRLVDICRCAISCKAFAKIARSEWLWQQMCDRNGIIATEGQSHGWRAMYTSLRQVRAINWIPQPMAELSKIADMLRGIGIPAGHAMICADLDITASASDPLSFTAAHPAPFAFEGSTPPPNTNTFFFERGADILHPCLFITRWEVLFAIQASRGSCAISPGRPAATA
jgi:hypothetical protein